MGSWGPGLYSNDIALDIRGALKLLLRTPLTADEIVETLMDSLETGRDPDDENYTTFWLALADGFAKAGLAHEASFDRVREIHASGADARAMERLGMAASDLRKRHKAIADLTDRLDAPLAGKPRKLMKPQPPLFAAGDVLILPSWNGQVQNPFTPALKPIAANSGCRQGWSLAIVLHVVHVFDVVVVYAAAALVDSFDERPAIAELMTRHVSEQAHLGTLSARHAEIMGIERLGQVRLDPGQLDAPESAARAARRTAAEDISLSNFLGSAGQCRSSCPLGDFASLQE